MPNCWELLITSVAHGGNLILNVGPTARGEFDYRAKDRLKGLADWMHFNERSIRGCTEAPAEFTAPANTLLTYNPTTNRMYLHLLKYPTDGKVAIRGPGGKVAYAQFLHDASEIFYSVTKDEIVFTCPKDKPPVAVPVVEVFLK